MSEVLFLCTANRCRSVMAAALLGQRLSVGGAPVVVRSAGLLTGGQPPPAEVVAVMAGYGIEVADFCSSQVRAKDLARADLVLAMAREHLRDAIVLDPGAWARAFTLRELVRRGVATGPRGAGQSLADWLARVHDGRKYADLLGQSATDDVADPMGGPRKGYARTAGDLDHLTGQLAELCWAAAPRAS
jgi:protein-tyrosine-phosphatase